MRSNDKLEVAEAICDAFQMSHEERVTAGIFRRWSDPQLMRTASGVQLEIPWLSSNPAAGLRVLANFDSGMQRFESCRPSLPVGSPPRGAAAGKELRLRHCASHGHRVMPSYW